MVDAVEVGHLAHILEEWDMKPRPNKHTGHSYEDIAKDALTRLAAQQAPAPYQDRVREWVVACFGADVADNRQERSHRFLEEALELAQAAGCSADEARQLVDYVYGRAQGVVAPEVGDVMITLAALASAHGVRADDVAEKKLAQCWEDIEKTRAKWLTKPKFSPLPSQPAQADAEMVERVAEALYACEKERSDRVDAIFAAATKSQVKFRMEHWNDVADLYRNDARAALTALPSSGAATASDAALREAAQDVITHMFSTYRARNGREVGIQGDDGEKCYIVHSDYIHALEQALSTHTEAEGP